MQYIRFCLFLVIGINEAKANYLKDNQSNFQIGIFFTRWLRINLKFSLSSFF